MSKFFKNSIPTKKVGEGDPKPPTPPADPAADLKAQNEKLLKEIEELKKGAKPPASNPEDLASKAAKEREENEKKAKHEKNLESAIRFTGSAAQWAKDNAALLPKNIEGIIAAADKENYKSAIDKDAAIKVGILSEFFGQKANLDLLTGSQKVALEEFQKLTQDKKQEQASQIYDSVFEPTFENLKKVKRAEQVSKGFKDQSTGEQAYRDRRIETARKQHLGEK